MRHAGWMGLAGALLVLAACGRTATADDEGPTEAGVDKPSQVPPEPKCQPTTCAALGRTCGSAPDGCGGTLSCGGCGESEACGAGGTPGVCGPVANTCADVQLGQQLPVARAEPRTHNESRFNRGSCGSSLAGDVSFQWTAPEDGTYVIDTARSAVNTLLYVLDGSCEGAELACDDNSIFPGLSRVTLPLKEGQTIVVVVDTDEWDDVGAVRLHINRLTESEAGACGDNADNDADGRVDCADEDCAGSAACAAEACTTVELGSALPVQVNGTTGGSGSQFDFVCTSEAVTHQQDQVHHWTAPHAGTFVVHSTAYVDSLWLVRDCSGREPICSTRTPSRYPAVKVALTEGESILAVLQSWEDEGQDWNRPYSLRIGEYAESEAGHCDDGVDNNLDGAVDCSDAQCAGAEACAP